MNFKRRAMCLLMSTILIISIVTGGTTFSVVAEINNFDISVSNQSNTFVEKVKLKNGQTFTKGKFCYKIISLNGKNGKVSLVGTKSKSIKKAKIPNTVKKNDYTFKVTTIGNKAFMNCKKLKSVTVNSQITAIGKRAFYGCRKLKKINIPNKKLKKVGKDAFKGINKNAVISVPKDKYKAYKAMLKNKGQKSTVKVVSLHTHSYSVCETIVTETCTTQGQQIVTCSCGAAKLCVISSLGHDYLSNLTVDSVATCSTEGLMSRHCRRCKSKIDVIKIDMIGHAFTNYIYNNDAVCTKDGTETAKCDYCGKTDTRTKLGSALGHDYSEEFTIDVEPTCDKDGSKSRHCSRCEVRTDVTIIDKLGHSFDNYVYNDDATCTENGTETAKCKCCNEKNTREKENSALGHSYSNEFTIDVEPTCDKDGTKSKYCSRCGEQTEVTVIDKLGHSFDNYVYNYDATCTENGTETAKCKRCNAKNTREKENSALGHDYSEEFTIDVEPTCDKDGTKSKYCSRCGEQTEVTVIDKLGHSFDNYVYNDDATCTENGTETAKCKRCNAKNTREKENSVLGHSYSGEFTVDIKPTCETYGSKSRHCSRCEVRTDVTVIDKLGHSFDNYVYNDDATCTEDGTETATCIQCSVKNTRTRSGSALGHDYSTEFTIDSEATCETYGSKSRHCNRCDSRIEEMKIEKIGHKFTEYVYNEDATCIADGTETTTCSQCGKTETRTKGDTALGYEAHQFGEWQETVETGCTSWGVLARTCQICGEQETQPVQPFGHSLSGFVYNNDAKCTEDGTETASCIRCDYTDTQISVGSALGHYYSDEFTVDVEATCTEKGSKSKHCIRCDEKSEVTKISKLGHSYTDYVYNEDAKCTEDGTETRTCSRCSNYDTRTKTGSALGHSIKVQSENKQATCTEIGYTKYSVCSREDCTYTEIEGITAAKGHTWDDDDTSNCTVCGRSAPDESKEWRIIYYADTAGCNGQFISRNSDEITSMKKLEDKNYVICTAAADGTVSVTAPEPKIGYKFIGWSDGVKEQTRTDTWRNMDKMVEAIYTYDYSSLSAVMIGTSCSTPIVFKQVSVNNAYTYDKSLQSAFIRRHVKHRSITETSVH